MKKNFSMLIMLFIAIASMAQTSAPSPSNLLKLIDGCGNNINMYSDEEISKYGMENLLYHYFNNNEGIIFVTYVFGKNVKVEDNSNNGDIDLKFSSIGTDAVAIMKWADTSYGAAIYFPLESAAKAYWREIEKHGYYQTDGTYDGKNYTNYWLSIKSIGEGAHKVQSFDEMEDVIYEVEKPKLDNRTGWYIIDLPGVQ